MSEVIGISNNRLNHVIAVARKMQRIVSNSQDRYTCTPEEAFVLGYMHDIGYEFTKEQTNHAQVGGEILRQLGYKYWREVFYHSTVQDIYTSPELILLNYCDITTGPNGEDFTIRERTTEIGERYGIDSHQYNYMAELEKFTTIESWFNTGV